MTGEFTTTWNRRNLPQWATHLAHLAGKPLAYLEIGVWEAYTICWMMGTLLTHPESRAVGVDPWDQSIFPSHATAPAEEVYARAVANTAEFGDRVQLIRSTATRYLATCEEWFDIVFIDGRHTVLDVLTDTCLSWRVLKPGGILIFDDAKGDIRTAIESLTTLLDNERLWENRRQIAVVKR